MSEIEIQCLECGGKLGSPLNKGRWPGMICLKCKRYYTETEISS